MTKLKINLSFLIVIFMLFATPVFGAVTVISGPDLLSTTTHNEETPTIVLDANENAHIIWTSQGGEYLYYRMVDKNGNTIIGPTNLTPAASPEYNVRRPSAEIDASGDIHIVFHGFYLYTDYADEEYAGTTLLRASEVIYTKIDPTAYIAGGQSDLDDLIEIPEMIISTDDGIKSRAPNAALDGAGQLHVTWFEGSDNDNLTINYLVLNLNGGEIAAETALSAVPTIDIDWGEPEIAVDSNNNGHIVYSTQGSNSAREIYYIMVSISGGISKLIDDTRITADDGTASVRAHLVVDSSNMVHVVWHNSSGEVFYSKLNPYLDDRNGSTADPATISLIQEDMATPDNGEKSNQKNIAVDSSGGLHLAYADGDEWEGPRDLYYTVLDTSGASLSVIEAATRITDGNPDFYPCYWNNSSSRHPEVAIASDRVFITFPAYDNNSDDYDIYLSIITPFALTSIPTINEWGMIIMSLILAGAAFLMMRRRQLS